MSPLTNAAAMEPAVQTAGAPQWTGVTDVAGIDWLSMSPQWSPPSNGGSTRVLSIGPVTLHGCRNGARRRTAGAFRHLDKVLRSACHTAMEPAAERREHLTCPLRQLSQVTPQWSPPLNGGSTCRRGR